MSGVQRWVFLAGQRRVFEAALIACGIVLAAGCHGGVDTPVAPSVIGASVPTASSTAIVTSGDVATAHGAPLSFTMDEVGASGYSGTCTVGTGGSGFRIKAVGNGTPNTVIRFILRDTTTGGRYTDIVEVDQRGAFRGQDRVTFFPSGLSVECLLIPYPGETILAQGVPFEIP